MTVVTCIDVAHDLSGLAEGSLMLSPRAQRHVEQCLRCQTDLVQYRKLLKTLRFLRTELLDPAPGLVPGVLAAIEAAATKHAVRASLGGRRGVYLGGIAAATAAGAAGAIVLATRSRRLRPAS
jgi:hypothetical protein